MSHYVIAGGREGKERLKLLSQVLLPTTSQLLNTVDLRLGMRCLDVGCGGGHVALLMASSVGPHGVVVGSDSDGAILALARQDAEAAQLSGHRPTSYHTAILRQKPETVTICRDNLNYSSIHKENKS
jgi:2-polyprenyl-3-methyl-5-hydroxy-6-metoxy-1,4-benzoquinol methylase